MSARAGILMLPVVDKDGTRTFRQIILYAASLIAVSLLPAVMGFAGVAVDVGYWQTTQRRMQGVADEAAFAAAMANYKGASGTATCPSGTASGIPCTTADAVAHDLGFANGANNVTVTVNNPPSSGSHSTNNNAYEVIISQPQPMWFGSFFLSSAPTTTVRSSWGRARVDSACSERNFIVPAGAENICGAA